MTEEKELVEQFRRKQLRLKDFDPKQKRLTDWIVEKRKDDAIILKSKDGRAHVILSEIKDSWLLALFDDDLRNIIHRKYENLEDAINALVYACKYYDREYHFPFEL